MSILIDPPTWAAHGTVFSHLISDTSLSELHAFARAQGVSKRAFDMDHYDVPAHRYDDLVAAGARPVSGNRLTRVLVASGLRVPLKERPSKIRRTLVGRWERLLPGQSELGLNLLARWEEPHRSYHNSAHLLEMLNHLERLAQIEGVCLPNTLVLAAWFHDAVYQGVPGSDEAVSADLARQLLAGLVCDATVEATAQLVQATATHSSQLTHAMVAAGLEQVHLDLFFDADLAILGSNPDRYRRYVAGVRAEFSQLPEHDFVRGRLAVLKQLTAHGIFVTDAARQLFAESASRNTVAEMRELEGRL